MTEATPRPWAWFEDGPGSPYLATVDRGRIYVMGFARRGLNSAQPMFQVRDGRHGEMKTAAEIGPQWREHPDAALIVTAVNSYDRLVAIEKAARRPVSDFAEPQDETDDPWGDRALAKWFDNLQAILEGASE